MATVIMIIKVYVLQRFKWLWLLINIMALQLKRRDKVQQVTIQRGTQILALPTLALYTTGAST